MLEEDHGRFQARPEIAILFQALGERGAIEPPAVRANDFVLLRLDHDRFDFGQLRDLWANDVPGLGSLEIVSALIASLDFGWDDSVRIVDPFTDRPFMTEGRPLFLPGLVGGGVALLIGVVA